MASQAILLLQKQLKDLCKNSVDGFSTGLVDENNIFEWSVAIIGPQILFRSWKLQRMFLLFSFPLPPSTPPSPAMAFNKFYHLRCLMKCHREQRHWEKNGSYSVKSTYHILCNENSRHDLGRSENTNKKLWKEIWKSKVPNCVRNFLWRLAKNFLSTRSNLARKGMRIELECPLCGEEEESQIHLFMHCPAAQALWFTSPLGIHVPHNTSLNNWPLHSQHLIPGYPNVLV